MSADDKTTDPKDILRVALHGAGSADLVLVPPDALRAALRELGELRQVVQQQAKGLRDAGNAALAEHRNMGRVLANAAAASALRENARLRAALQHVVDNAHMHPLVFGLALTKAQDALAT